MVQNTPTFTPSGVSRRRKPEELDASLAHRSAERLRRRRSASATRWRAGVRRTAARRDRCRATIRARMVNAVSCVVTTPRSAPRALEEDEPIVGDLGEHGAHATRSRTRCPRSCRLPKREPWRQRRIAERRREQIVEPAARRVGRLRADRSAPRAGSARRPSRRACASTPGAAPRRPATA